MFIHQNYIILVILVLITLLDTQKAKAGCPFGYEAKNKPDIESIFQNSNTPKVQADALIQYPYQIFTCPKNQTLQTGDNFYQVDYLKIVMSVIELYENLAPHTTPASNPRASFAGCLVRTAGHDFMDFRMHPDNTTTGGMDACINFNDPDNAGLKECLQATNVQSVYQQYCDRLSLADFFVIMSEAAIIRTEPSYSLSNLFKNDTFSGELQQRFKKGRITNMKCNQTGLLPDPEAGCSSLENVFIKHIYSDSKNENWAWAFTTAISGAHTLGGTHLDRSGFSGSQTNYQSKGVFDNQYYKNLLLQGWGPNLAIGGNPNRNQWQVIDQSTNKDIMMLNSDICLAYGVNTNWTNCAKQNPQNLWKCMAFNNDSAFSVAKTAQCCAFTDASLLFNEGIVTAGIQQCGSSFSSNTTFSQTPCCGTVDSCDSWMKPSGPGFNQIVKFAANNSEWLRVFNRAWVRGTENGAKLNLKMVKPSKPDGKKPKKQVKSFADVVSQSESFMEFLELIWENPWSLLVLFNLW